MYGQVNTSRAHALLARDLQTNVVTTLLPYSTTACPDYPSVSPDGSKIVFTNTIGDSSCGELSGASLQVYDVSTGTTTTLVSEPTHVFAQFPHWSPDGSKILYTLLTENANGVFVSVNLYTVPAGGGSPTALGGGGVDALDGVYSPDGTKIAFSPNADNYLAVMNADGSNVVALTKTAKAVYSPEWPSWSPDGTKIAYSTPLPHPGSATLFDHSLAVVAADNSTDTPLASTKTASKNSFVTTWSSDGTQVYYDTLTVDSSGDPATNTEIDVTGPDGARNTRLVTLPAESVYSPTFVGPDVPTPTASTYTPITPTRVLPRTTLNTGGFTDVQVAGGSTAVPVGATAVTLNLTGVAPSAATYLQAYPTPSTGNPVPLGSAINLTPGLTAAVAVQVTVGAGGKVRIRNYSGNTGVIVDLSGYFIAGSGAAGYFPLATPARVLDGTINTGTSRAVTVTGVAGAPVGATAVVLNLTGVLPATSSYQSVYPTPASSGPPPTISNLNLTKGITRANLVTVPIGAGGQVSIFNYSGAIRTIVDVQGFYAPGAGGLAYYPLTPVRVLDTRNGTNTPLGSTAAISAGKTFVLPLAGSTTTSSGMATLPANAGVAVFNLTAAAPTSSTYLTVFAASSTTVPMASNLNPAKGAIVSNLVISKLGGTGGGVRIFNANGTCPVLADLSGYYA